MRGPLVAVVLALLVATAAPAVGKRGPLDAPRMQALDYLGPRVGDAGALVANIVEGLHANGVDPATWPTAEEPVSRRIIAPAGGSNISVLRPLRALAFVKDPQADPDGAFTANVLARFRVDGYGDPRPLNDDAYAILAVRSAGIAADDARVQAARTHLLHNGNADGGWGWTVGAPSSTDLTAIVLEALLDSGGIPAHVAQNASAFLQGTRLEPGFAEMPGGEANCESTVWGIRGSARAGLEVRDADWGFLLGLQRADGGFAHLPGAGSDLLCTTEAFVLLGDAAQGRVPGPDAPPASGRGAPSLAPLKAIACVAAVALHRCRRA